MIWLFNVAAGSVIIVTLFHAGFNISNNELIPTLVPELNRMFANNEWIYAVLGVLTLVLVVFTKGRLSYRAEHAAPAAEYAPSGKVERGISGSEAHAG